MPPAPPGPERRDDAREDRVRWDLLFEGLTPPWIVLAVILYGGAAVFCVSVVWFVVAGLAALSQGF
jgi:hypothetical protein